MTGGDFLYRPNETAAILGTGFQNKTMTKAIVLCFRLASHSCDLLQALTNNLL